VAGVLHPIAATNWSLSGSILTFAMPMLLFILAAAVLYRVLWWPHRIPGHSELVPALATPPDAGTAQAMAVAAGLSTAPGAGADPLAHEPAGAHEVTEAAAADRPPEIHQPGTTGTEDLDPPGPADPGAAGPEAAE
jgi:hypothetical protein